MSEEFEGVALESLGDDVRLGRDLVFLGLRHADATVRLGFPFIADWEDGLGNVHVLVVRHTKSGELFLLRDHADAPIKGLQISGKPGPMPSVHALVALLLAMDVRKRDIVWISPDIGEKVADRFRIELAD